MSSAKALNVETGEFFPLNRVRSLPSGDEMTEALGYAWACDCRGRLQKRFDEQYTLRESLLTARRTRQEACREYEAALHRV
jgi:hypothetical protein